MEIKCTKSELLQLIRFCERHSADDTCRGCLFNDMSVGECDRIEDFVDIEIVGDPCDG